MARLINLEFSLRTSENCIHAELNSLGQVVSIEIDDGYYIPENIDVLQKLLPYPELESITLSLGHSIKDISCLSAFKQLRHLDLMECTCDFEDISVLSELKHLETIKLYHTRISSLVAIGKLNRLRKMYISGSNIEDINPIKYLSTLEELALPNALITEVDAISHCKILQKLQLQNNNIEDISPLEDLLELVAIDISGNNITYINALHNIKNISNLDLSNNKISNGEIIMNLTGLKSLKISQNKLTSVSFLREKYSLTVLDISNNPIHLFLNEISELKNLTHLNLDGIYNVNDRIKSLPSNLVYLSMANCNLDRVEILTSLVYLNIGCNQISDVDDLIVLQKLKQLDLRNNRIEKASVLMINKRLDWIYLNGNLFYENIQKPVFTIDSEGNGVRYEYSMSVYTLRERVIELNKDWGVVTKFPSRKYSFDEKVDLKFVFSSLRHLKERRSPFYYLLSYEVEFYLREHFGKNVLIKYLEAFQDLDYTKIKIHYESLLEEQNRPYVSPDIKNQYSFIVWYIILAWIIPIILVYIILF